MELETDHKIIVELSDAIISKIEDDIKGTSFENAAKFIESLVKQKYPELLEPVYTEEEEEIIRKRLRRLGYIE